VWYSSSLTPFSTTAGLGLARTQNGPGCRLSRTPPSRATCPHAASPSRTRSRNTGSSYIQRATGWVKAGNTPLSSRSIRSMGEAVATRRKWVSIACRLRDTRASTFSNAAPRSMRCNAVTVVPVTLNRASSWVSPAGERYRQQ